MKSDISYRSERLHKCPNCSWYRDVVVDAKKASKVIAHRIYGKVSVHWAAQLDVKNHNCVTHTESRNHARELAACWTRGPMTSTPTTGVDAKAPSSEDVSPLSSSSAEPSPTPSTSSDSSDATKAPDGAPWYAHLDGPCGPECRRQ